MMLSRVLVYREGIAIFVKYTYAMEVHIVVPALLTFLGILAFQQL